jgi:hypothetical protein
MGMVGLDVIVWLSFSETLQRIPTTERIRRVWRWAALLVLSGWLLVRLVLAINSPSTTNIVSPYIPETFTLLALIGIVPLVISPVFRQVVREVPLSWLIGIHTTRLLGFVFLGLLDMKLMPDGFALPAGYGDILAALLALIAMNLLIRKSPLARGVAIVATVWGIIDFTIAIVTGTQYLPIFVRQLNLAGISPIYLNYILLIPAFAVPLLTLLHVYSLVRLFSAPATTAQMVPELR